MLNQEVCCQVPVLYNEVWLCSLVLACVSHGVFLHMIYVTYNHDDDLVIVLNCSNHSLCSRPALPPWVWCYFKPPPRSWPVLVRTSAWPARTSSIDCCWRRCHKCCTSSTVSGWAWGHGTCHRLRTVAGWWSGGRFKNTYERLKSTYALKISKLHKNHKCMG